MALAWPTSSFEAVFNWVLYGGWSWKNVLKFRTNAGALPWPGDPQAVWTAINTEVAAILALMNHNVTLQYVEFADLNTSDVYLQNVNSPGSKAGDALPPQVSALSINKSGLGDRSGTGRTYWGGFSEADQTGLASLDGAFLSALSSAIEDMRAAAEAIDIPWCVVSFQDEAAYPIQAAVVQQDWRTQKRRAYR